jgi:branched-chain amino acid transport system substrate-binding protein
MKRTMSLAALAVILACGAASAQRVNVKIGVLSDMSGLYSDVGGPGSVAAAKLAIADFGKTNPNVKVDLITGDHHNKTDIGLQMATKWYDAEKVDMIVDVPNSGVALAVSQVTAQKNKVLLVSGAAASDLTGTKCNANTIHWTYDTWMLANGTGKAIVKTGGNTWFFLTSDYAFGHALERDTAAAVENAGGKVIGEARHPLNTKDFSSFLVQAQASKAKIIGLANAGGDTIKQGAEFGIVKGGQKFAGLLIFVSDVNALGLPTAQGLILTSTWYWDMNDANRAWTKRWQAERNAPGKFPTMVQAGVYSAVIHYLKAVALLHSAADGKAIVAKMKAMPTDDLFEVKAPWDSKHPGDFYTLRATIPAEEAFRPLKDGSCPLASG